MTENLKIYRCGTCLRCFESETSILDHQSLWSHLHAFDHEIDEHDGVAWTIEAISPGDYFDYFGERVEFMGLHDEGFVYRSREPGRGIVEKIGSFDQIYVPRASVQLARAWSAASELGLDDPSENSEVSMWCYAEDITTRWHYDQGRLAEERHWMLAVLSLARITR